MTSDNHLISRRVETSYRAGFVPPNPSRDLDAYDRLPQSVRQALDDAPWGIDAVAALHHLRLHGIASVLREIKESCDAFYAAFERETGVPRPHGPLVRDPGRRRCRR